MNHARPTLALLAAALLSGCGGGGAGNDPGIDLPVLPAPASFVSGVRLPYFPMPVGTTWIFDGEELGRPRHEEVRVLEVPRVLAGIVCTGLEQTVYVDGLASEITTEWFAEDRTGNVWKLGEESLEPDGLGFVPTPDSWVVGRPGTWPFLAFPADPLLGSHWIGYVNDGFDTFVARSRTATASVPAGTFPNCLEVAENPDDPEDADIILYGNGVGRVSETSASGFVRLTEIRRP